MAKGLSETKLVKELQDMKFYIPAYQRGYRWTSQEVKDLLDDIYEFDIGNSAAPRRYCLQPLLVKERENGLFEVVDGQQRLTTLFIFLKIAQKKTDYIPYALEFETRKQSGAFLSALDTYGGAIDSSNIDYFHITNAYATIQKWIDEKCKDGTPRINVLYSLFEKITEHVFFIWYELPDKVDPAELFTRVNMGKIRLSNAELIKALLLREENFQENADKKQQELALEWNRIERGLQNDSFWYFLVNEEDRSHETRIDLIFDLLAEKYNQALPESCRITIPESSLNDNRTFLIFYAALKQANNKQEFVDALWKEVEAVYERFVEWYADLNKYHIIGFLICTGTSIQRIFGLSYGKRKSETIGSLVEETKKNFTLSTFDELSSMSYDDSRTKRKLKDLFLLFNIATLVCRNEKQYRFPFDIYKKEKWDIEHIHATADPAAEPDDGIGNLTLLSAEINRSYKDAPFFEKRRVILERDKNGMFIPVCTKNVFMKAYSDCVGNMELWEPTDKDAYLKTMWEILDAFWKGDFIA